MISISTRRGSIQSVEDWFRCAPPKGGEKHWVDKRSAKELARAWCGEHGVEIPAEIDQLLNSCAETKGLENLHGSPELQVRFDSFRGGPRNTDLGLTGTSSTGRKVAISIEAKADEPFGSLIADKLSAAATRIASEKWTNIPARIQGLAHAVIRPHKEGLQLLGELRYQLLTATAGALAFAVKEKADLAVLIVHVFRSGEATHQSHQNSADLARFIGRLQGRPQAKIPDGRFLGPFLMPGSKLISGTVPLLIGKVSRQV